MSFEFDISDKDLAATDFMDRAYKTLLAEALHAREEQGLTQSQVAKLLEVDKSAISRALSGRANLTLRTIGELCWALDIEPSLVVKRLTKERSNNLSVKNLSASPFAANANSAQEFRYER